MGEVEPFDQMVDRKRQNRMAAIDALPSDLRELVHEYGYSVVRACMDHGLQRTKSIRHIVETVLDEFSPTRGAFSKQGRRVQHDDKVMEAETND